MSLAFLLSYMSGAGLAQDLAAWCEQHHTGYVSTVDPAAAAGVMARLEAEPQARLPFEAGSVEAGWYKQVLILQPLPADPSWVTRLSTCFDPADAKLLVREVYGRPEVNPETTQYILDAIEILGRKDATRQARLREACLWLAAPALGELRWQGESLRRGIAFLRYHPTMPAGGGGTVPFSVECPLPRTDVVGEPTDVPLSEQQVDVFARWLAKAKLPLTREQYVERQLAAADRQDAPFIQDERLSGPVLLGETSTTLSAALTRLSALARVPLSTNAPDVALRLALEPLPLRQVLVALARATGTALRVDGQGYTLARPTTPREQLLAAVPLAAWSYVQHDRAETWVVEGELRARFYGALDAATPERLRQHPSRLQQLAPPCARR